MAEETKTPDKEEEIQEETPKKAFPIKILIIALIALLIIGGGIFALKSGLFSGLFKKDTTHAPDIVLEKGIGPIYPLSTFIVNLIGDRGKNYLKAQLDLELSNEGVKDEIDGRLPQFKDAILTLLSSKNQNDIKTLEGKYQLREEIISTLNQFLVSGKIVNVYFTDFIVQ